MCGLFRVFVHEFRSLRQGKRGLQRRVRLLGFALAEEDVVLDRAGEQNGLLRHIAELVVKRVERILAHVQPVYKDSASRRVVKARNEGGQRRLAAAGRADDGQRLALFYLEADMLQLIRSRARIAEGDIAELDRAGPAALCLRAGDDVRLCVQHLVDALCRDLRLRHEHEDHHEHHKGHHNIGRVGAEHQHVCEHRQPCGGICQRDRLNQRRADPVDGERQPVHAEAEHRLEQGEQPLVFQLQVHHLAAGAVEFPVLIVLRAEGMDDVDAGQIFPRDAVDLVGLFLHLTEPGQAAGHDQQHHHNDCHNEAARYRRERPAFAEDLDDGPDGHDRGLHEHLQAHGDDHLNLGNIVGRSGDEAGDRKGLHFLAARVHDMVEQVGADGKAEAGGRLCRQIPAADSQNGAGQRTQEHLAADG